MNRYVCIHGHFYQPPRENPWLEDVERQDSAYPYHDWNERITAECYAPNSSARILDHDGMIVDIVSNYKNISFNFGPTLLSWLEVKEPEVYRAILEADRESQTLFSGHGSALAQCYNHMIMPLANSRDKKTQVGWGIRDFEFRFGRKPAGMWLPETAVDLESLELLVEHGVRFTILAPRQAKDVKKFDEDQWRDVSGGHVDPKRPYLCRLPSGKEIVIFFYDGPVSRAVAFEKLLDKGEYLADRLLGVFGEEPDNQLVHISTDGETYGHHHKMGDMALAYCLNHIREQKLAKVTNYGEYLETCPPDHEVRIHENSSWSCVHGVERWRSNCGCSSGMQPDWNQEWREPLRGALDWLRENLIQIYDERAAEMFQDPWLARDDYIDVILNRSDTAVNTFFQKHAREEMNAPQRVTGLKLLEMQRNAMLMYTSCGWFFDEVSGIETVQVMQYAARAMQLAEQITGMPLEETFLKLLEKVPSNLEKYQDARVIYEKHVRPSILSLVRVGVHFAISSLFEEYSSLTEMYCYRAKSETYDLVESGKQRLATGRVNISSRITEETEEIMFAVLHLGDHHFIAGVVPCDEKQDFKKVQHDVKAAFKKSDVSGTIRRIEEFFGQKHYSLWHLFRDEQSKILYQVLDSSLENIEASLHQINEHHTSVIQVIKQLGIPLPKVLAHTVMATLNTDLMRVIGSETVDFDRLRVLIAEVREWSLEVDRVTLEFMIRRKVNALMTEFENAPKHLGPLKEVVSLLRILQPLQLNIQFWKAQNVYFRSGQKLKKAMADKAANGNSSAKDWLEVFEQGGQLLKVRVV